MSYYRRLVRNSLAVFLLSIGLLVGGMTCALAQDLQDLPAAGGAETAGDDTVRDLSQRGRHFEALVAVTSSDEWKSVSEKLAAARSAWALGLVRLAREYWDEVFANREFRDVERSRAMLGRAIMELQESQYEEARMIAERGAGDLPASELRAQFWLVIAEALKEQDALSLAEEYYKRAMAEARGATRSEAAYLLGECQFRLGMINDARYTFTAVEADSTYAPRALKKLVQIDLVQRNYAGVLNWIDEGREGYSAEFSDGWVTYAFVTAHIELGNVAAARKEIHQYQVKNSDRNAWFMLAESAIEANYARGMLHEPSTKNQAARSRGGAHGN